MYLIKKIGFWLFVLASVAVAIWGYFRLKESKAPNASVLEHIPAIVACVIETKDCSELVSQLTRQNLIWNSLLTNESMLVAQNGIQYLDSLVNSKPEIAEVLSDNSLYWSFIKDQKTTRYLILFKAKEKNDKSLFIDFFKSVFAKDVSVTSREVFYFINNKQKWFLSYSAGIVYLSSDLSLLERSIQLKKEESLATYKAYNDLIKLNGEQKNQVYFNNTLTGLLPKDLFTQQSLFSAEVQLNEITLTGYTSTDSLSFFDCLKNQEPARMAGYEHLPDNPVSIKGVALTDVPLFYKRINKQLSEESIEQNVEAWKTLNDSALYNIKKESDENIDNELATASYFLSNVNSQLTAVKIKDEEKAAALLKLMSDSIHIEGESKIYKLRAGLGEVFSFSKSDLSMKYACISKSYILFFSDHELLNYYRQSFSAGQLLVKNKTFMDYANDNFSLECNYIYYENSELMKTHHINSIINSEVLLMSENPTSHVSITAKNYKSSVQVRLNASHAQPKNNDANSTINSLWNFVADSVINGHPNIFTNHLTQENELCFQDETKQVYLINSTGNLIWKKKISETIQSDVYTVDIFKNGKLQLLFNTENYLHLLDRNGNYVHGFPVKLPAKITSNLTLLDYENNKDYRLFVACADRHIYNFSLYGIRIEGFVPVKTDAEVILPISYAKVGASDYLITADVSGKIYAFSRKGLGRIDFKNKTIERLEHLQIVQGNNLDNTKLVYVDDKNNLLNKISLTDKKEALKLGDELAGFKTSFALVNDDSQTDLLAYGNGAFYAYDLFTSKLIEYFSEPSVYNDVQLVQTSDSDLFLAFDKPGQKADVINTSGKLSVSFPGATQKPLACDLYKNGKTYVLLVSGNQVSCQELK